jgi:hypothetical protein
MLTITHVLTVVGPKNRISASSMPVPRLDLEWQSVVDVEEQLRPQVERIRGARAVGTAEPRARNDDLSSCGCV